jgi:hypothetical protein
VSLQYVSPQCAAILGMDAAALYADTSDWWAGVHGEADCAAGRHVQGLMFDIADVVGKTGERGRITIRTVLERKTVRISIADTGPGIPAAIGERIYDPFFTTKPVGRGTGQGLAITRTIVERHDGTISFDTIAGAGTTFHIILPSHTPVPQEGPQRMAA